MHKEEKIKYGIAYKWLSWLMIFSFVYYWLFTLTNIFLPKKSNAILPRQAAIYRAFIRQNWHLFSTTKFYNRQLNVVIKDKSTLRTDTIDIVNYSVSEKRKHAPFNNYEDAIDHILYLEMNAVEVQSQQKTQLLKKQFPNRPDSFYLKQSSLLIEQDSLHQAHLQNLVNYVKYVLKQKNINIADKEYQLLQVHKFIPPQVPGYKINADSTSTFLFISTFKNF